LPWRVEGGITIPSPSGNGGLPAESSEKGENMTLFTEKKRKGSDKARRREKKTLNFTIAWDLQRKE